MLIGYGVGGSLAAANNPGPEIPRRRQPGLLAAANSASGVSWSAKQSPSDVARNHHWLAAANSRRAALPFIFVILVGCQKSSCKGLLDRHPGRLALHPELGIDTAILGHRDAQAAVAKTASGSARPDQAPGALRENLRGNPNLQPDAASHNSPTVRASRLNLKG